MSITSFLRTQEPDFQQVDPFGRSTESTTTTDAKLSSAGRFLVIAAVMTVSTMGVVAPVEAEDFRLSRAGIGTLPAGAGLPETVSAVTRLRRMRDHADLTWGEIADALGVSRRSIHLWLNGGRIAPAHEAALSRLDALVMSLPGTSVMGRRNALVLPQANGRSVLDDLALSARKQCRVPLSTVSVAEQLGVATELSPVDLKAPDRKPTLRGKALTKRKPRTE